MTALDAFHAHLDMCPRCANEPFNLCAVGGTLIQAAVDEPNPTLAPFRFPPPLPR